MDGYFFFVHRSRAMSSAALEQRVAALEKKVDDLLANQPDVPANDLRSLRGMFTGDDLMKEIFDEGRKIREAERKRARRQTATKRKPRP
jgi:hypothetical protein